MRYAPRASLGRYDKAVLVMRYARLRLRFARYDGRGGASLGRYDKAVLVMGYARLRLRFARYDAGAGASLGRYDGKGV